MLSPAALPPSQLTAYMDAFLTRVLLYSRGVVFLFFSFYEARRTRWLPRSRQEIRGLCMIKPDTYCRSGRSR